MYCKKNHSTDQVPCVECQDLIRYADTRLERCKFGDEKPVCKDCVVHCYSKEQREKMKTVMKWSGPRMIYLHPLFALVHLFDSRH